ncbi:Serine/threonine-protein phosphatase 2A 55 kDa regulatory subunit B beta isoform [Sparganum proliferum]
MNGTQENAGDHYEGSQKRCNMLWYYDDIKGVKEDDAVDADQYSCIEYDSTGEFLAVGDRGGRVSIFHLSQQHGKSQTPVYETYHTFTSHESEFDYLKSLEIEEKIIKVRWIPQHSQARHLLSTNEKTIKLWRLSERMKRATGYNSKDEVFDDTFDEDTDSLYPNSVHKVHNSGDLRVPRYQSTSLTVEAQPRRIFANAHAYHINSISISSDQETFISADDLRINLWNLQVTNQSFNIVDIKPANMEDLKEVITAAEFHPSACALFVYSSSKGILRLCDMRQKALCDDYVLAFHELDPPSNRGFFSEIINSVSDLAFSKSGRYILSRDYLTLKVWDLNMSREPVETYHVHDYFRSKFCSLYENDCIFDKFECSWSPNDNYLLTGSYNNLFRVFDRSTGESVLTEVSNESDDVPSTPLETRSVTTDSIGRNDDELSVDCLDLSKKLLYLAWHPSEQRIALTSNSSLFLASGRLGNPA